MNVLTDEIRTARKIHKCIWCGKGIDHNERYHYFAGPHDGKFQTNHMHIECFDQMEEEAQHWGPDDFEFVPYVNERPEEE